jgi:hypothetical protein
MWALMGMPCGKYLVVMRGVWLPGLAEAGDLDKPFATEQAVAELKVMSAATVDRYLKPARDRMHIKGILTTKPSPLLRNSIAIRICAENCSIRNNAATWTPEGIETAVVSSSTTRSPTGCRTATSPRPGRGRTRKKTRRMWNRRTTMRWANTRSAGATTPRWSWSSPRRKSSWATASPPTATTSGSTISRPPHGNACRASAVLHAQWNSHVAARIEGVNPADLTRQINTIRMQLLDLPKAKTEAFAAARHVDLETLQPSINRLAKMK